MRGLIHLHTWGTMIRYSTLSLRAGSEEAGEEETTARLLAVAVGAAA